MRLLTWRDKVVTLAYAGKWTEHAGMSKRVDFEDTAEGDDGYNHRACYEKR